MDALLTSLLLMSTLAVSAFFFTTGVSRFVSGKASGFTRLGAPNLGFPLSAAVGAAEVLLALALLLLAAPRSMAAAYVAMIVSLTYAWRAGRTYRQDADRGPGGITGSGMATLIGLCGLSTVAIVDALTLQPALARLADPAVLLWILVLTATVGGLGWILHRQRPGTASPSEEEMAAVAAR